MDDNAPSTSGRAVLTHSVIGPESPAEMGTNFTKQGRLIEEARRRGLEGRLEYEDWSVHLEIPGPPRALEDLARWADEVLGRCVDVVPLDDHPTLSPTTGAPGRALVYEAALTGARRRRARGRGRPRPCGTPP